MGLLLRRILLDASIASSSGGSTTGGSYTVNLNSQWEATTAVSNPDSTLYDGVYRSSSNYNVNNGVAIMYITIKDCSSFKMYIRSYAESNYDYVMVSQLDKTITGSTSYSDATLVKAHTRGNQQSGTALSSYTLVEFTGITSGEHTITVVYRKDSSAHSGDDRGYVLIEKTQVGSGDSGGDEGGGSSGGSINIDNYLTIKALENGLTAKLSTNACEYCVDGDGNWKSLAAGTATESINSGQTLSFRSELTPASDKGIGTFTISKKCNLKGNCMSMLFGDNAANNYSLSGKDYAFYKLFYNCTNIVNVSSNFLPATTLANDCYNQMFYGCSSLTVAPVLPATTLAEWCYYMMFDVCTSLTTAPALPATTLAYRCYDQMFSGCTSLTTAPELPATTLAINCYSQMFVYCTGLTTAPAVLPATTLANYCYSQMFKGCKSLTVAPELPATTLAQQCYKEMFYNCTSLTNAPSLLPAKTLTSNCYSSMFRNCTSLTTAPELPATTLEQQCYSSMFQNCSSLTTAPELPATTLKSICYSSMFQNCSSLTTAPELPATTLANSCYSDMFYGCTSLTTAPELPATTLASNCYDSMFYGCTSLTTAPELPATTLANYCYDYMFRGCTSLTTAPELPATTLANSCYYNMFYGCSNLTTVPELPVTTLADYCYGNMFYGCSSLITAPELPATTLVNGCYSYMFNGCKKINYIKMLATDISASGCLTGWVQAVASSGTFVKNPSMTTLPTGIDGIPSGWTVVDDGEESGNLITFTVDGTEYQAEEGMTWGKWVDSEYNVINASIYLLNGIGHISTSTGQQGSPEIIYNSSYYPVTPTNEIISNHNYIISGFGGGS